MNTNPHILRIEQLSQSFGNNHILHDLDFVVTAGQILALVGPSGCGKSTLLNSIVGTHKPSEGRIMIRDNGSYSEIEGPGRDRGIVYQRYSLFPFLTAQENVAMGLMLDQTNVLGRMFKPFKWRKLKKAHLEDAAEWLKKVNLGNALKKYPAELSGGMCQRVAIAQALIMKPRVLLMDEPFGALDEATREDLQRIVLTLYNENQKAMAKGEDPPVTIIIVTHEIEEAIFVADRMVCVSQYWDWKQEHEEFPGARIVYDNLQPVFKPDDPRDLKEAAHIKETVMKAGFDPDYLQQHLEHVNLRERAERRSLANEES